MFAKLFQYIYMCVCVCVCVCVCQEGFANELTLKTTRISINRRISSHISHLATLRVLSIVCAGQVKKMGGS